MQARFVVVGYIVIAVVLMATMTGCGRAPHTAPETTAHQIESSSSDRAGFKHIATAGHCKLYRVRDGKVGLYWSVCASGSYSSAVSQ